MNIIIYLLLAYLISGFVFYILFSMKGMKIIDDSTVGSSIFFKLILLPGMLVFWPVFLIKWMKAS